MRSSAHSALCPSGWSVVAGTLSLGSLVAFYSFVAQLVDPLSGAAELYTRAQRTFASIRRQQAVFALRPSITNSPVCADFLKEEWGLEFEAVEFGLGETWMTCPDNGLP
jgi:ABC-type multidrug transport system fused ATPase/permease subunit